MYEKIKVEYVNVFHRQPLDEEQQAEIQQQVKVRLQEMKQEMEVSLLEQTQEMQKAVEAGEMLPERYELELKKAQEMQAQQLEVAGQQMLAEAQQAASIVTNTVISAKEFKLVKNNSKFADLIVEVVPFYSTRIQQSIVVGDSTLRQVVMP